MYALILTILLQSTISTILISFIFWLARNYISSWMTRSIQHKYDCKLEKLRAQIREEEQARESIQKSITAIFSQTDNTVKTYRLNAIDKIWRNFLHIKGMSGYVTTLSMLNIDELCNRKEIIDTIFEPVEILKEKIRSDKYQACRYAR